MHLFRIIIFLLSAMTSIALQAQTITQLYGNFLKKHGTEKVQLSNLILKTAYQEEAIDTLLQFKGSSLSELQQFATHYVAAESYLREEHYPEALKAAEEALSHSSPNIPANLLADCHFSLSTIEVRLGNNGKGAMHAQKAYELDVTSANPQRISSSLNNLACIYLNMGHAQEATDIINKAIEIEKKLHRDDILAIRYGVASEIYIKQGKTAQALNFARKAYQLNLKTNNKAKLAVRLSQMAEPLIQEGKLTEARDSLLHAVTILLGTNSNYSLSVCYRQLGDIEAHSDNISKAKEYYYRALTICKLLGNRQVEKSVRYGLWKILRDQQPSEALQHLEAYTQIADSFYHQQSTQNLAYFKSKFDDNQLKQENQLQRQQKKILLIAGTILFLLLILLLLAMWRTIKLHKAEAAIIREIQRDNDSLGHDPAALTTADTEFLNLVTDNIYQQMRKGTPDVDSLASQLCMTPSTLLRRIRAVTGQTTIGFIQQTRINYAKRLLREEQPHSIGQIAHKCGFDDAAHFSRVFKAATGQSPTQYMRHPVS
ncbi:MAG: helix-turn-helix domain-containing protein [Alloprevotella sp.]|nr:helix-turn-helix domain-containing protein [Alloprevotella sp.]